MLADFPNKEINCYIRTERVGNSGTLCQVIYNAETDEPISRTFIKESDKPAGRVPKNGKQPHFYKLYKTNWNEVVKKKHLTPYETGVFFMLLSYVGWESNFLVHPKTGVNLNCSQLSTMLNIARSQLDETLKTLNRKGFIAVVKCGDGGANHYMLNSNVVFWGSKIKDESEHYRFIHDCSLELPIELKYQEREPR